MLRIYDCAMRKILPLLTVLFLLGLGALADQSYQLFVNDAQSKFPTEIVKGQVMVPVYLPADTEEVVWTVTLKRDEKARKVLVKTVPNRRPVRGENPCNVCQETGKCPNDYPAGSGFNTSGTPCYLCTGTGNCYYCQGTGKW